MKWEVKIYFQKVYLHWHQDFPCGGVRSSEGEMSLGSKLDILGRR